MNDILSCAWSEMSRRKNRAIVTAIGYAIAVAVMIIFSATLLRSKETSDRILTATGTHAAAFLPACTPSCLPYYREKKLTEHEGFVASGISTNLIPLTFLDEARKLEAVKDLSPFLLFQFRDSADNHLFTVGGFDLLDTIAVSASSCAPRDIIAGRFLLPDDSGAVVVEQTYAQSNGISPGDAISVAGRPFAVVGIINTGTRPVRANIYMKFTDARNIIERKVGKGSLDGLANVLLIESKSAVVHDSAIRSVKRLFPSLSFSGYQCYKPAAAVMGLNADTAWVLIVAVGIATLLFSSRSQYSSVVERCREIGILKSMGWSNRIIVAQILVESILLAFSGGILGLCAAFAVLFTVPFTLSVMSLLLSVLGGVAAGIVPAYLAARMEPASALRSI